MWLVALLYNQMTKVVNYLKLFRTAVMIQTYSEQTDLKVSQATKIRQFSPSRHQHDRNVWVILLMQTLIIIILPQVSLCCWTTLDCAVIKFKYEHSHFTVLCWYPTTSLCLIMKYAALKKSFYTLLIGSQAWKIMT